MRGRVEFGEEICIKTVVRGGGAMGCGVGVEKFRHVGYVRAIEPALVVKSH